MDLDRMASAWRDDGAPLDPDASLAAVRTRARVIEATVARRDRLESGTAYAMLPVFGALAVVVPSPVAKTGAALIALTCGTIPARLRRARGTEIDRSRPVREALLAELALVTRQRRLLGGVAWWYLLPLGIGVILFMAGGAASPGVKIGYALVVLAGYTLLWSLNRRAVRRELDPLAARLSAWIATLDDTPAS